MIVDDEAAIRRILSVLLAERGHEIGEAESGEEAIQRQSEFRPDLVLLDLSLPGLDGLATLQQLIKVDARVECIMMTAFGTIRSAVEAMRLGAFDYLTKPFDNDELLLVLDRAIRMRRLGEEVEALRAELGARYGLAGIIGISRAMQDVFRIIDKAAPLDATILILGESGTGKELAARAVHARSRRSSGPFVAVNCSAIPEALFESEFFGYEKGAFTDARERRTGKFEQAGGGTLFLDEIGDLPTEAQAKLLRALQEREITRLGSHHPVRLDVRVIAATNRDLAQAVHDGRFRQDLYWRINVVAINLPPLRQRRDDLPLLIDHLLDRFNRELGLGIRGLDAAARQLLVEYDWPGNVRELENVLCQSMILSEGDRLTAAGLPPRIRGEVEGHPTRAEEDLSKMKLADVVSEATERLERRLILSRLAEQRGNRTATAESLGISRKTLFNKMKQYGITAGDDEDAGTQSGE